MRKSTPPNSPPTAFQRYPFRSWSKSLCGAGEGAPAPRPVHLPFILKLHNEMVIYESTLWLGQEAYFACFWSPQLSQLDSPGEGVAMGVAAHNTNCQIKIDAKKTCNIRWGIVQRRRKRPAPPSPPRGPSCSAMRSGC